MKANTQFSVAGDSGYIVLATLVLLIGAGSVWLSVSSGFIASTTSRYATVSEQQGLVDARQSLLSYAALYASLYGPSGAGPGHLPCPDTDGFNLDSPFFLQGSDQSKDGANPPCAALSESAGLLPRHTVLPGYRYLFHAEPWQKYQYVVSGDVINNPLNRLVNLESLADHQNNALAILSLKASDDERVATTPVTAKALTRAVSAAVADWVVSRSRAFASRLCLQTVDAQQSDQPVASGNDVCIQVSADVQLCPYDTLLLLLVDTPFKTPEGCLVDNVDSLSIEGTAAWRHWFVRNSWFESIVISGEGDCIWSDVVDSGCELHFRSPGKLSELAESKRIALQWSARI